MEYMFMPLKRYADFSGRSRRKEYWMFALLMVIVFTVLSVFMGFSMFAGSTAGGETGGLFALGGSFIVFLILWLAILVPAIAVQVRRFHDQDKSGWFVLLNFIPYVGSIVVLVFMCLEGTRGPNRYGPDPKGGGHEEVFA